MSYEENIRSLQNPNFSDIIEVASFHLQRETQLFPWKDLNPSDQLISQERQLQYLCSYGKLQENVLEKAWAYIPNAQLLFHQKITIIDWNCRLALATCCFIDSLRSMNIDYFIDKIILINKFGSEINLARLHTERYVDSSKIKIINKSIEDIKHNDLEISTPHTVHLFADSLSDPSFPIEKFANSLKQLVFGKQIFICSETALSSSGIDSFAKAMDIKEQDILASTNPDSKVLRSLIFTRTNKETEIIKKEHCQKDSTTNQNIRLTGILNKSNVSGYSELKKILEFYRIAIELEQYKEPEIKQFFPYPIHFKGSGKEDIILIDFPCNNPFYDIFQNNRKEKWPKDLYIGLTVTIDNMPYRLLSMVINYPDLKGFDPEQELLPCFIKHFNIDTQYADELQLSLDKIDEINASIRQVDSFTKLNDIICQYFGERAVISKEIYLALSQKNPALSQILSELNKLIINNSKEIETHTLLSAFLTNSHFENVVDHLTTDDLIQITLMDQSQGKAIAHALNNRLSVITGAPGTGKTQVILNILANALLRGKSVLVASKNNKAVDNVKERFDEIEKSGYLLRFGTKALTKDSTLPAIERVEQQLDCLKQQPCEYEMLKKKHQSAIADLKNAQEILQKEKDLSAKLVELQSNILSDEQAIKQEDLSLKQRKTVLDKAFSSVKDYDSIHIDIDKTESILSDLRILRNRLQRKYTGFRRIWNNWFNKKKHAKKLLYITEQLDHNIRRNLNISDDIHHFRNGDEIIRQCTACINHVTQACDYKRKWNAEVKHHTEVKKEIESRIKTEQKEYNEISAEVTKIQSQHQQLTSVIRNAKQCILTISIPLLSSYILHLKQQGHTKDKINKYKTYLPDNIPWQTNVISDFINNTKNFLEVFKLIAVTSLSIKGSFPLTDKLFDILVIDEASQCDIVSAIPLIYRAKQVVVIGDPMQLKHITAVNTDEEKVIKKHLSLEGCPYIKYGELSLWDYCYHVVAKADKNNRSIMLENHYRCHHKIINYSNNMFYSRNLQSLKIKTDESKMSAFPLGMILVDVKGKQVSNNENINLAEVDKCIELAQMLSKKYPQLSIGIVTPFRQQVEKLNSAIPEDLKEKIDANTIHKYQGDEKDIMIYSLVVTDNSPASKIYWIDKITPNLVNVAITRARQALYIVGNANYIKKCHPVIILWDI